MSKIKILVAIIVLLVFGLLCQTQYQNVNRLKIENIEKEKEIANLNADRLEIKENCEKIVEIDNKIILDMAEMFSNLDKYYEQPELMILDASVLMSGAERNVEKRNELLDEIGIEYQKPITK